MSASLMYHTQGIKGFQHKSYRYEAAIWRTVSKITSMAFLHTGHTTDFPTPQWRDSITKYDG